MRLIIILIPFLVVHTAEVFSQEDLRIMFYNVENMFDTLDDPEKEDDDFLPDGFMRWTPWKYWEKLRNIARVITAVGGMQSPALVGLCEIENDSVVFDLTKRSPLRAQEYEYIISCSPDNRGINVALLYQRHQFKPVQTCEYEIKFKHKDSRPTRNILHVTGEILNGNIIDIFVCHFPSRSGGQRETEPARIEAATLLKNKTDSLFSIRENARIIIMGDFNDHPNDKSLAHILNAGSIRSVIREDQLYNPFRHRINSAESGTYKYRGQWEIFDQFIVSGNILMDDNSLYIKNSSVYIFDSDFLLEDDEGYYGKKPYRTNIGPRYVGGFSDHLPIYTDLSVVLE